MTLTEYQAKFLAHVLTQRHPSDSTEKLAGALVDAKVDLHPHQVEAALFAFRSPFSKGAVLADEVGLGKTIEAGLVISQKWAERKRNILIIAPANLRKQWYQELQEKFFLPSVILEGKSYNAEIKAGNFRPFDVRDAIVICSYQFAKVKASDVHNVGWDLVVIDEAHRLRNVYKPNNVIANTIKAALQNDPKLLLTATPLQNSLLELFGLVSIIDEHAFGDFKSFREQFSRLEDDKAFEVLKARLAPVCHRTLRRQVTQYVSYTKRHAMVEEFTPERIEQQLYDDVSEYLRRDKLMALPRSQRHLMTLVLRKLLASSTFAIAGALDTIINRLEAKVKQQQEPDVIEILDQDFETLEELKEEWEEEAVADPDEQLTPGELALLIEEIGELKRFRETASSITNNAKGKALLTALNRAMDETQRLGGQRKAIIFTESRKTQDYLVRQLENTEYGAGIVLFNGTNNDERSRNIYNAWLERHQGSDRVTGSRTADMRSAIVDYFRNEGSVMIATEAGAEGINLQFCSLVVNYDLPWNPQRIEQRIGRSHRYGQKHDVVVLNFVNLKNEADKRVYELLNEKFKLFSGVFGASDEVLGAIESGVDLEKRIADIYQQCRTDGEIAEAFDKLQGEFQFEIEEEMKSTRVQLIENLDQEVIEKLRVRKAEGETALSRYEQMLMDLTRFELFELAEFEDDSRFTLRFAPGGAETGIPSGVYELPRRSGDAHLYRMGHPLAEKVLRRAKTRNLEPAELTFDWTNTKPKITMLGDLRGKSGELTVSLLTVEALDQVEDYFVFAGVSDGGEELDAELVRRMLSLTCTSVTPTVGVSSASRLAQISSKHQAEIRARVADRNGVFFDQETMKLEGWADDLKLGLERELKELERQLRDAKKASLSSSSLNEKLEAQKLIRKLESERSTKRRSIFEAQDEIEKRRDSLIGDIEAKLQQSVHCSELFAVRWKLI